MIFDRRPRQRDHRFRSYLARRLPPACRRILDARAPCVEDGRGPSAARQKFLGCDQQPVRRHDDVAFLGAAYRFLTIRPGQPQEAQGRREARCLVLPVPAHAHRRHDECWAMRRAMDQERQRLHCLAEAHVVGPSRPQPRVGAPSRRNTNPSFW